MKKLLYLSLVILFSLLLSSCMINSLDAVVELKSNERYVITVAMGIPTYLSTSDEIMALEQEFSDNCELQGFKCSIEAVDDGDVTIISYSLAGKGYETLNDQQLGTFTYDEENKVLTFRGDYDSAFLYAAETSLTIKGKKIITSNGYEDGRSVTWSDPANAYAEFQVGGLSNLGITLIIILLCLGVLVGALIVGGIIFLAIRKKKKDTDLEQESLDIEGLEMPSVEE